MKYRKTRYSVKTSTRAGKRRLETRKLVLILCISAVVGFAAAAICGAILGGSADSIIESLDKKKNTVQTEPHRGSVPEGEAPVIDANTYSIGGFYSDDADALSAVVLDREGKARYLSPTAQKYGTLKNMIDLEDIVKEVHRGNIYFSGILFSTLNDSIDKTYADFEMSVAFEKAMIHELSGYGVDDIVISGLDIESLGIDRVCDYLKSLKSVSRVTKIGMSLTPEQMIALENESIGTRLLESCDFLVLDCSGLKLADEGLGDAFEQTRGNIGLYKMRLLFDQSQSEEKAYVRELGYKNIQSALE